MKTNVIKLRFVRNGEPSGREYTYFTNVDVVVGDLVDIDGRRGLSQGIVTAIDVPEEEIAPFKDVAKTIIGKSEENKPVLPTKEFNATRASAAQTQYCALKKYPHFAPHDGRCWKCNLNIYEQFGWKVENGRKVNVPLDSLELQYVTGIDVEKAGKELVTGCPHCNRSYCD